MSTFEISKSSLVSLKAEIVRKHQELAKAKSDNERKIKLIKKNTPLEFKNKNLNINDKETTTEIITESEDIQGLLNQSRRILEQKSALYERLRSGQVTEEERQKHKSLLVQFDKNIQDYDTESDKSDESETDDIGPYEDDNMNPAEKWVDYVDCLGRTRKCLQGDLEYLKSKDKELEKIVEAKKRAAANSTEAVISSNKEVDSCEEIQIEDENKSTVLSEGEMLSSDMRRELLRQQWEKEEDELRNKSDIHYQDILFGEARSHGVGYYGFSKNEEERLKQQEALKQLREETEQKQKKAQELKMMRDKLLAARIKAAKDRRRARLGLPPEEEEEKEPEKAVETEISEEERQKQIELEKQKEEKEMLLEEARKHHLRPWDVGKEGITTEHHEMSQEEWNEMKRSERVEEFAPPTIYTKDKKATQVDKNEQKKRRREKKNKEWRQKRASLFQSNGNNMKNTSAFPHTVEKNIVKDSSDNIREEVELRSAETKRGAEIPPPMDFDYFGPTSSKLPRTSYVKNDINESIEAGLKFLRNQMELKKKPPKEVFYS